MCDALRNLVPFANLKIVKKTPPWVFFTFLKLQKWYHRVTHHMYLLIGIAKSFVNQFMNNIPIKYAG